MKGRFEYKGDAFYACEFQRHTGPSPFSEEPYMFNVPEKELAIHNSDTL